METFSKISVVQRFDIIGQVLQVKEFGSGHINDTYRVYTDNDSAPDYLLQRINHHVFKDVALLMNNMWLVTEHLKKKMIRVGEIDVQKRVITLIPTLNSQLYHLDEEGNYWRMMILIDGTNSYDIVENESQAWEVGKAFGEFQSYLADPDAGTLGYTIPNFCNSQLRMKNCHRALAPDVVLRCGEVMEQVDYILTRDNQMNTIIQMAEQIGRAHV